MDGLLNVFLSKNNMQNYEPNNIIINKIYEPYTNHIIDMPMKISFYL